MDNTFLKEILSQHQKCEICASPKEVAEWIAELMEFLFPDLATIKLTTQEQIDAQWDNLQNGLRRLLTSYKQINKEEIIHEFFNKLPYTYSDLKLDIVAMYEGDPAAKSEKEIIISYPGFLAICSYRIAHVLHNLQTYVIPRLITENAHSITGIDIHPAAEIGKYFCIDHGTGIVIGETTLIGNYVKLYQGVTLGALSVNKTDADTKRHPTLEDRVVVYAGATILGGKTIIGENSIIGGNVWITKSVPPNTKVYYKNSIQTNGDDNLDTITIITED